MQFSSSISCHQANAPQVVEQPAIVDGLSSARNAAWLCSMSKLRRSAAKYYRLFPEGPHMSTASTPRLSHVCITHDSMAPPCPKAYGVLGTVWPLPLATGTQPRTGRKGYGWVTRAVSLRLACRHPVSLHYALCVRIGLSPAHPPVSASDRSSAFLRQGRHLSRGAHETP